MSRFKIFAFIALITLAFAFSLVGDALAGEKIKNRMVGYTFKFEPVEVGDQGGHVVAVGEAKGINSAIMGKRPSDGMLFRLSGLFDLNVKTGVGSYVVGYTEYTDRDGDKIITKDKGKYSGGGNAAGEWAFIKGTGKFEGIQGKGTWIGHNPSPTQWYVDTEGEVELPKK